jgi:putative chitinase
LLEEANAMISALWFWKKNNLNSFADKDDIIGITKRVNGGLNGIEHRKQLLEKWKS